MTVVKISETYDLSTEVDKMGIIGIHTPKSNQIASMWKGLAMNHRYMKLLGCDVTIACASMLPADPQQIGTEAGKIAPQDMFNPILYKAVSNDSFNGVINRIYGVDSEQLQSISKTGFDKDAVDQFALYYGLLSDDDGWRKAMPQSGLEMKGLYPIVHEVLNTYGNMGNGAGLDGDIPVPADSGFGYTSGSVVPTKTFRGESKRMPRIPTLTPSASNEGNVNQLELAEFPTTYVACIITPPAKLNRLFYRMKIVWSIEFTDVCPLTDNASALKVVAQGRLSYVTDYAEQSSAMSNKANMVDVANADLSKVMEGSR